MSLVVLFVAMLVQCAKSQSNNNDPSIISPNSKIELIKDGFTNLEGTSVSPDGRIFFVDLITSWHDPMGAAKIWIYNPNSNEFSLFASPTGRTVGTEFDNNGNLICAEFSDGGGRRITLRNVTNGEARFLANGFEGKPFNGPNDLTIDRKNRIYFTDYVFTTPSEVMYHPFGGVYRIDPNGNVNRIIDNAGLPNGIVISPDQKTLYVATNGYDIWGSQAVLAYDLSDEGTAIFRNIFVDFGVTPIKPDGLTIDMEGNLYVSLFNKQAGAGVKVYSPSGKELAFIKCPTAIQNVTFGRGKFINTLFMVGQDCFYKVKLETKGYHLNSN